MKNWKKRFKKLAGLNEQLDPVKDVGSGCANKTQIELYVNSGPIESQWNNWMTENPNAPYFQLTGGAAAAYAENLLTETQGGGLFYDFFIDVNPGSPQETEPYCPYIYSYVIPITFTIYSTDGTPQEYCNGDVCEIEAQSIEDVLSFFNNGTMFQVIAWQLGIEQVNSYVQMITAIANYNQQSEGQAGISMNFPDEMDVFPCGCTWTEQIAGCMDPEAFNYNEEANVEIPEQPCEYCDVVSTLGVGGEETCCDQMIELSNLAGESMEPPVENNFLEGLCPNLCGDDGLIASDAYASACCQTLGFECVGGCIDENAINFEPTAHFDDGTCEYVEGCTVEVAFNYNPEAVVDDGSCEPFIYGCMDSTALNYNENANTEEPQAIGQQENPCVYVEGCTDSEAYNFNPESDSDDGSCAYNPGCMNPEAANYDEAFDIDDGTCYFNPGCMDPQAFNFTPNADFDDDSCIPIVFGCLDPNGLNYTEIGGIEVLGPPVGLNVGPIDDVAANTPLSSNMMIETMTGYPPGPNPDIIPAVIPYFMINDVDINGLMTNFDPNTGCMMPNPGCMDEDACNYDNTASVSLNEECDYESCVGCTEVGACNYDSFATISSECDWESCAGCIEESACNYDPDATVPTFCDWESCAGCMDPEALNYDPDATIQPWGAADVCEYEDDDIDVAPERDPDKTITDPQVPDTDKPDVSRIIRGCTDEEATNYNPEANTDDGSCKYEWCADWEELNAEAKNEFCKRCCEQGYWTWINNPYYIGFQQEITFWAQFGYDNGNPMNYDHQDSYCECCQCPGGDTFTGSDEDELEARPDRDFVRPTGRPERPEPEEELIPLYPPGTGGDPFRPEGEQELIPLYPTDIVGCMNPMGCLYNPDATTNTYANGFVAPCALPGTACQGAVENGEYLMGTIDENCDCIPDWQDSDNNTGIGPNTDDEGNEFVPDDGRPPGYNYWHDGEYRAGKEDKKLNENLIKRFQKLANIKKKK